MGILRSIAVRLGRHSHEVACRNALAAASALAERGRERREVGAFLAGHAAVPMLVG
jgi:hypothetical protein